MDERESHAVLIQRLVEDGGAVRRVWSPEVRLGVWLGAVALVLAGFIAHSGWPFALGSGRAALLAWEVVAVIVLATVWAALALRTAVPGREPSSTAIVIAIALVPTPTLFWLERVSPQLSGSVSAFITTGIPCALLTVILSLLSCAPLLWALRRGAPLTPSRAATLAGGAAFSTGYLLMRFYCDVDEPAHLLAWHALPAPIGVAAITAAGGSWLARWRSEPKRFGR